ncbi:MAG: bifunctional DNA-formamidopyrimidine glycosylase/DNA-(apurinic or apyrimidinic site) lyase [Anaerolineae bacterium]
MPELPEVETVVRTLAPRLVGARVEAVDVLSPLSVAPADPEAFTRDLTGRTFDSLGRRGKYVVAGLDRGYLIVHLRMTGQLLLCQKGSEEPRFARLALHLDQERLLWFSDMRKFGRFVLTADPATVLGGLGPEPFDPSLDGPTLHVMLRRHKRPLKSLLLDQTFVAGLGNIYADETLFVARLHPLTPANQLSAEQAAALLSAMRSVLSSAIDNRGTTIANYVDAEGRPGENQFNLSVYGRAGESCRLCQAAIEGIRLSGRSSCFCPQCQPADRPECGP